MNAKRLRVLIPVLIMVAIGIGFVFNTGIGTLSAIGWKDIALLCPLGALSTMIASKTIVPQAVVSLILAAIAILIFGRAFCAWICPVPIAGKLRTAFKKPDHSANDTQNTAKMTKESCESCNQACCAKPSKVDSRHFVLGSALLSAAIFGFPVFCLICPIGLVFATIMLFILLFGNGDVTWSLIAAPALLAVEIFLLRKWCTDFCPLSALMSLVAKANRTFKPVIDDAKCLEVSKHATCGKCAEACEIGIDPRHPERGASWSECTKCRACVEACPTHAISMPLLSRKADSSPQAQRNEEAADSVNE